MTSATKVKAQPLTKGSRVGLVAPGWRPYKPSVVSRAAKIIEEMGFVPVVGNNLLEINGHSAGTVSQRADDLNGFFRDPSIEAVICVSGGFGGLALLPDLDFDALRKHPKIIVGGGENTTLLLAIRQKLGLITFHGPNLQDVKSESVYVSLVSALTQNQTLPPISAATRGGVWSEQHSHISVAGKAEGVLLGGDLTGLASLFGTQFEPDLSDSILFLTDYDERNDILDRWFTTLFVSGQLAKTRAVIMGSFDNCGGKTSSNLLSLEDLFGERLTELAIPSMFDFPIAGGDCPTVPLGVKVSFDTASQMLSFEESALV